MRAVGLVRWCQVRAWAQKGESRGGGERRGLARGKARMEEGKDRREEARFFSEHVQMPECCVRGKRGELANKGGG